MGHKGVSKRKPKQIRVPPSQESASSTGNGSSKDVPQTATPAPKVAEKSKPAVGTGKNPKK